MLRILLFTIFAAALNGCTATVPLQPASEDITAAIDKPDRPPAAEQLAEPKTETPNPPAAKPVTVSKPATVSPTSSKRKTSGQSAPPNKITASDKDTRNATTPVVGSPEWKKERAEDERKERHIKEVIDGICRGC